jgi:hypothetical protein
MKIVKMADQTKRYTEEKGQLGDREKRLRWLDRILDASEMLWCAVVAFVVWVS